MIARLSPVLFLAAFSGLLFFPALGARDLNSSHEARAAQNAQMLLSDGDWLLPRLFDRTIELQKPPLYYWLVAALASLRGTDVDVWAVRLPSACAALGCVLWLYYLGQRRGRPLAGLLAALVLASCLHFTWLARVGRIDMPLTFAITLALGCFELGWRWAGYTALALGVLLKGPIAIVLVVLVAGSIRLADRSLSFDWRRSSLWWGIPWVLLLTAPWFLWANIRTGGRLWDTFFWHHNLERGLGGSDTLAAHPWWFYLPRGCVDLLPWSVVLPAAGWWYVRRLPAADREARAGLAWFAAVFLFLSCMSFKRADYLVPAYPGFAIFLGAVGEHVWMSCRRRVAVAGIGVVLATYAAAWCGHNLVVVPRQEAAWPYQQIAREIRRRTARVVVFFRAESHLLAFHLGRPIETILEWENLQSWANVDFPVYFVMPEESARELPQHLPYGALEEVFHSAAWLGPPERPLVVLRNRGKSPPEP